MPRPSIESLFDATIVLDADGRMRNFSPSAEKTFGRTATEVAGRPFVELVPRYLPREREGRWRTPAIYADGSLFPVELAAWKEKQERTIVLLRDLRDHDLQAAPDEGGWWEIDPVSREGYWSPRTYALHGAAPGSFVPTAESFLSLVEPEDRPRVTASLESMLAGERTPPFEYRLASPPGGVRILSVTVLDDLSLAQDTVHGVCSDVTGQRLTRARLSTHEAVAAILGNWENGAQEMCGLMQHLFLVLGWKIAVAWIPDEDHLSCRAFVAQSGMEAGPFEQAMRDLHPRRDDGTLCGRAWADQAPRAVPDAGDSDLGWAALARQEGIRGAMAIPAVHGGEVIAVLEFFTPARRDYEPEMLDTLGTVGRQLGGFLAARRSLLSPPLLTTREREVLLHAADGESVREIAEQLVISSATVKTHLQNVYGKLGVNDRPAAVALALRTGLIA